PNDPGEVSLRGMVERRQNRWDDAIADLTRASKLDPRDEASLDALCETQLLTRRYADAQQTCGRVVAIEPEKGHGYYCSSRIAVGGSADVKSALAVLEEG